MIRKKNYKNACSTLLNICKEQQYKIKVYLLLVGILGTLSSCKDEIVSSTSTETFISLQVRNLSQTLLNPGEDIEDDIPDNPDIIVRTLRILVFDENTNQLITDPHIGNVSYPLYTPLDIIKHPVIAGSKYTIVFLANEDPNIDFSSINEFNDLKAIAYSATSFISNNYIPMMQVIKGVEVAGDGKIKLTVGTLTDINGKTRPANPAIGLYEDNSETNLLILRLDKLAVRLNIVLNSAYNLATDFEGLNISNIPDKVPLFQDEYTGAPINRNKTRSYNADVFTVLSLPTGSEYEWSRKLDRVILPANHVNSQKDATILTVKLIDGKYSPSCELQIGANNYNLPYSTWLDFIGNVKQPLEVNIKAKDWEEETDNWEIAGNRILNVSHTNISMTDMNGVRVSFYSNMPRVMVLPECTKNGTSTETNVQFNDLANPVKNADGTYSTTRFHYDPATGGGYMDILADGGRETNPLPDGYQNGTYKLILSADDGNGTNTLEREITVTLTQNGFRFANGTYAGAWHCSGVFFRNEEKGERIFTQQYYLDKTWTVTIDADNPDKDFIILSTTPSFDPGVGTDNPGDPEKYPVVPNEYKGEDGTKVTGKGRIYFRIGMKNTNNKTTNPDGTRKPKYARMTLTFRDYDSQGVEYSSTRKIYIRQGEDPDYIFNDGDIIGKTTNIADSYQPLANTTRSGTARFSPYNLTAKEFKNEANDQEKYFGLKLNGGTFVDYPSQGGAFFQWGLRLSDISAVNNIISPFYRRAYSPCVSLKNPGSPWISTSGYNANIMTPAGYGLNPSWQIMWGKGVVDGVLPHGEVFETCPPGYRRPTDGLTTEISTNGPTPTLNIPENDYSNQIKNSELRVSLFTYPFSGDANPNADLNTIWGTSTTALGTYPNGSYGRKSVNNTLRTFYADGFFDRRPIKKDTGVHYAVAIGTPRVAYSGLLFVNPTTKASIFFPATGRVDNVWADFSSRGTTGYYWSSTAAPLRQGEKYINGTSNKTTTNGAWAMEIQYDYLLFRNTYADFGASIRCVKDETATP